MCVKQNQRKYPMKMIEQLIDLLTRLVVAVEAIAQASPAEAAAPLTPEVSAEKPTTEAPAASTESTEAEPATPVAEPALNEPNPFDDPELKLDVEHHYWDEEIHASTMTFNAGGDWKLKRGVNKELVAEKIKKQDYLFNLSVGRSSTEAAHIAAKGIDAEVTGQAGAGAAEATPNAAPAAPASPSAPASPAAPAAPENATTTVRVPAHANHEQFTTQELTEMVGDCFVVYGEAFEQAWATMLEEGNRVGTHYTDIDEAAVPFFAWSVMEFVNANA